MEPHSFKALSSGIRGGLRPLPLIPCPLSVPIARTAHAGEDMVYTATDTAEPVAHQLGASAPKINDAPYTKNIHFARNLELVVNAALVGIIERLGQLHAARAEALKAQGIPSHQLAQFDRWEQGAALFRPASAPRRQRKAVVVATSIYHSAIEDLVSRIGQETTAELLGTEAISAVRHAKH
ncbi:hypothetical protein [Ferrimicrobium acidiphilum]|uniref:Uncharacterized protein n=1 Tax=Ferrimicrobium acidiphilum DSM 19497 TaxID=1121877 RepID=A0A0D8FTY2_9ACTN|nr:hypothetical protein [Ferrimicrobium acidiphilum]KJE75702.1 hypothetical protein FEAC_25440 [Ferrimicrobium acidiphilum DSM 19497]